VKNINIVSIKNIYCVLAISILFGAFIAKATLRSPIAEVKDCKMQASVALQSYESDLSVLQNNYSEEAAVTETNFRTEMVKAGDSDRDGRKSAEALYFYKLEKSKDTYDSGREKVWAAYIQKTKACGGQVVSGGLLGTL